ncbi:MAG: glycosyltransferase family 2 protein, partial [Chloroflexi bacterium]|nr:glycosyltransferase family 2 protein [Chloroflexota bacterium]
RELLRGCLQSVIGNWQLPITNQQLPITEIIVVDNASRDGTVEMVRAEFPSARVIANSENLGFTRANNQALAIAQGRYLFLLHPDTELKPGALQTLYDFAQANSRVGIIGPQLFYGDGSIQSSRRRFPTLATAFLESTILQEWFPRNRVLARYYLRDTRDDAIQPVDWINGAAMFVRRDVYDQIGGLDEAFFMYSEELDWCYRAKRAGWEIFYLPTAQVIHYEGKSSEQAVAARDIHFNTSKIRFVRKTRGAFSAEILRAFLLATFVFQIARESIKWLLGHKRALRAQRVRAYLQVLQSGLK